MDGAQLAATPRIVIQCEPARPTWRPNRPARIAPASGASTIASSTVFEIANSMPGIIPSALQGIHFGHVRSEERRVGTDVVRTVRHRGCPYPQKKKENQ